MSKRPDALTSDLTDDERALLVDGLDQWGGPVELTGSWARAMGFKGRKSFHRETRRLRKSIVRGQALSADDWLKVIQATELVFISDSVGAGVEWSMVTGRSDAETVALLRSVQEKWMQAAYPE